MHSCINYIHIHLFSYLVISQFIPFCFLLFLSFQLRNTRMNRWNILRNKELMLFVKYRISFYLLSPIHVHNFILKYTFNCGLVLVLQETGDLRLPWSSPCRSPV